MKKFISVLCALTMLCSFASASVFAAGQGSLTLNASYMADDWETSKDKVDTTGDVIAVYINAKDIAGMDTIGKKCEQFAALMFTLEYDNSAITPYKDTYYESNLFKAKYKAPKANIPTSESEGIITEGNVSFTSNTDEPGYEPNGKTTMIVTEATKGFCLNGNFMTFYFTVVDPSKKADVKLTVDTFKNFDNTVYELETVAGMDIAGMDGGSEKPVELKAEFDTAAASKFTYGDVYNYGIGGAVTVPEGKSATGVTFDISNGTQTKNYDFDFGTSIAADTSFGLNICRVPVGVELSFSNLQVK